jgi:hypothetical protein
MTPDLALLIRATHRTGEPARLFPIFATAPLEPGIRGCVCLRDRLALLAGDGRYADPLGNRDKFRHRLDLHFLHHLVATGRDCTVGTA